MDLDTITCNNLQVTNSIFYSLLFGKKIIVAWRAYFLTEKPKENKEKMFSKQLASDVVIVFLVQCSQGSEEQTGHQKQEEEEKKQCSLSNWLFLRKPVKST